MTAPTQHEKRPDAEVVVYGDDAPISDAEWHCARLARELYSEALTIAAMGEGFRARASDKARATHDTRAEAVATLAEMLADDARGKARDLDVSAWRWEQEGAALINDADRAKANAARLRALLGDDRGR